MLFLGPQLLILDITSEVSQANKVFDLVFEVVTFLGVVSVFSLETTIPSPILSFGAGPDRIRSVMVHQLFSSRVSRAVLRVVLLVGAFDPPAS
ncbi:hypothetical protein GW17_00013631 [Ensete ventricosum]|nr:hypothetical protein GW17_00013631 [Ensete ventricosum]